MVVLFEEIGSVGLDVSEELSVQYLDELFASEAPESGLHAADVGHFQAHLERVSEKVLVKGKASVMVKGGCKRCLAETSQSLPVEFMFGMVRKQSAVAAGPDREPKTNLDEEGSEASFELTAAEEEIFNGRQIDLGPILREQLVLALPMALLCREDCKGLCTVCGADLNEADCGCERTATDPRWAALKSIKLN